MRQLIRFGFVLFIVILSACTLTSEPDEPPAPTATLRTTPPLPPVTPEATPTRAPLGSETAPYSDATYVLDGICFEFLAARNGQTWVWDAPDDLARFYADVDRTELCPQPATRQAFDFAQTVLFGTTRTITGCDAAYIVGDTVQDDEARTVTIQVKLQVRTGCPYELVEPLVLGVPAPPADYTLQFAIQPVP